VRAPDRIQAVFEQSPLGIACVGLDGHFLQFNERFHQILGYTREQLLRIPFDDLTHPDDAKLEAPLMRRLLEGATPSYRFERRVMERRGKYRTIEVMASAARNGDGRIDCLVYFVSEAPERPAPSSRAMHDCGAIERQREAAEWRAVEMKRQLDQQMNELRIMANALRNEVHRRKAAEAKTPREEEMVRAPRPPARAWKPLDGIAPAELLVLQASDRRSGTLVLARGEDRKEIFFAEGMIFSVASNDPSRFLAQRLMVKGYITNEQRDRALEIQRETHLALGRILVILGTISEDRLLEEMRLKAEEEIADLVEWRDATYVFVEGPIPTLQLIPLRLDVAPLVVQQIEMRAFAGEEADIERELEANFAALAAIGIEILIASPAAKTKKFHRASCAITRRFDEDTRVIFTAAQDAEAAGYERCRVCFR
jgi:PAS domain S-box-containing protein